MDPSSTYCSISWDLHKSYISKGFSHLQKNEEFVDMTIAAEGHLVKVHQNIIALASPYIKEMLRSASCPHPIVFLNNVRQRILCYILEYIYTGEVKIPTDDMNEFIETSKALRIKGVENVFPVNVPNEIPSPDISYYDNIEPEENTDIHEENMTVEIGRTIESQSTETVSFDIENCASLINDESETTNVKDKKSQHRITPFAKSIAIKGDLRIKDITPLYTISNRGSLQLILNRYMYLCHHHSYGGRKRRWRCIDYRRMQCPAIVDTMDENVTNRIGLHSHGFHDVKILKKYRKHAVYTTISKAKEIKNNDKEKPDVDD